MALDAGDPMDQGLTGGLAGGAAPTLESIALSPSLPAGSGLRAAREFLGLSLQDVADITKIRKAYLGAVEDMALDQLPSRPFAIGYVRAYARALGLDEDAAISRFKQDAPDREEPLRAPVGVPRERDPRLTLVLVGGAVVLACIVAFNITQRAMRDTDPAQAVAVTPPPKPQAPAAPAGAPVVLGAALPPPPEATVPEPYVTPGLGDPDAPKPGPPTSPRVLGLPGKVYGAPPDQSVVTLQAVRSVSLVVHGPGNTNIYANELKMGDSYRAPNVPGLTFDVSAPDAIDVFVAGEYRGPLPLPQTPVSVLIK